MSSQCPTAYPTLDDILFTCQPKNCILWDLGKLQQLETMYSTALSQDLLHTWTTHRKRKFLAQALRPPWILQGATTRKFVDKICSCTKTQTCIHRYIYIYTYLGPQTTIYKWLFQLDDSQSLHRKWLFHQTSIFNWWFGVPGIYIYICIDTLTRYTDKDTSCYKHNSHQCTTHGKASLAKFKFTPQLMALPEGGVLCQNSQEMKKSSTKSANNAESNEGIAFQKHYYTWPKSLPLSRNSLIVKKP